MRQFTPTIHRLSALCAGNESQQIADCYPETCSPDWQPNATGQVICLKRALKLHHHMGTSRKRLTRLCATPQSGLMKAARTARPKVMWLTGTSVLLCLPWPIHDVKHVLPGM
jgi:hypothetical protein